MLLPPSWSMDLSFCRVQVDNSTGTYIIVTCVVLKSMVLVPRRLHHLDCHLI